MNVLTREQILKATKGAWNISMVVMAISVLVFGMLGGAQASAQTPEQAAQVLKPYSVQSQTVAQRLTLLNRLPAKEWRYHAGDLAHGE